MSDLVREASEQAQSVMAGVMLRGPDEDAVAALYALCMRLAHALEAAEKTCPTCTKDLDPDGSCFECQTGVYREKLIASLEAAEKVCEAARNLRRIPAEHSDRARLWAEHATALAAWEKTR